MIYSFHYTLASLPCILFDFAKTEDVAWYSMPAKMPKVHICDAEHRSHGCVSKVYPVLDPAPGA